MHTCIQSILNQPYSAFSLVRQLLCPDSFGVVWGMGKVCTWVKKQRLVLVVWEDIVHGYYDEWCDVKKKSTKLKTSTIKSVGWLVKEDKTSLTLCQNLSNDGDGFSLVVIPRGCITKLKKL